MPFQRDYPCQKGDSFKHRSKRSCESCPEIWVAKCRVVHEENAWRGEVSLYQRKMPVKVCLNCIYIIQNLNKKQNNSGALRIVIQTWIESLPHQIFYIQARQIFKYIFLYPWKMSEFSLSLAWQPSKPPMFLGIFDGLLCVRWWLDPLLLRSSVTLYQGVNQCCCFKSFSFGLRIRWSLALRLYVTQKVVPGAPEQTRALERWQYLTWSTLWRGEGKILGGSEGNWGLSLREDFWRNILNSSLLCIPQDHAWR